jgi:D-apionolactonase
MEILQAGPLSVGYENGFLRRLRYGQTEILRMIYFALRDRNWNTLEMIVEDERISSNVDNFDVSYTCVNFHEGVPVMRWKASIHGAADATITFEIHGIMLENFHKNRAGFCILHGLNVAGLDCEITHPDHTTTRRIFPVMVDPENPFRNIQSMRWTMGGAQYSLDFEGDLFETEDQRNWGDASYKTFCTPLDKPFPVELKAGEEVFQRVTFHPTQTLRHTPVADRTVVLRARDVMTIPAMGIGGSTQAKQISEQAVVLLRALRLGHYRTDLYPGNDKWVTDFSKAYETAYELGLPLEVALHLTDRYPEEMEAFSVLCQQNKVRLKKVLLLQDNGMVTAQRLLDEMSVLKGSFPRVLFGAGTNYNFNEINKNRFRPAEADYICFALDPQEHASDDLTILENTETLEHLVRSTKAIYGDAMPVHLSPITLRKRFNPYATNSKDLFIEEGKKADPRQKDTIAALFTFGCICRLTRGGAAAVTFFQTVGEQGIISALGEPYPVYDVLKKLAAYQGRKATILESSDPLAIEGILIDQKMLALANYSHDEKLARFQANEVVLRPQEIKMVQLNSA